jgi:hypothetical protein
VSADAISTCPECGEVTLREWYEFYSDADLRPEYPKPTTVTADYNCTCRECGYQDRFDYSHTYRGLS